MDRSISPSGCRPELPQLYVRGRPARIANTAGPEHKLSAGNDELAKHAFDKFAPPRRRHLVDPDLDDIERLGGSQSMALPDEDRSHH